MSDHVSNRELRRLNCVVSEYEYANNLHLIRAIVPDGTTAICRSAFSGCINLRTVVIPNTVTSIEDNAFLNCKSLVSVILPNNLRTIGNAAFCGCRLLVHAGIPETVYSIGTSAFKDCTSLHSMVLPNVTLVGDFIFQGCQSLTFVTFPTTTVVIPDGTFSGCVSLNSIGDLTSLRIIGEHAFNGCVSLRSIILPEGLLKIKRGAFRSCLISSIQIPSTVTSIGPLAFAWCYRLTTFFSMATECYIDFQVLIGCTSLMVAVIPSIKTLRHAIQAFDGCHNLRLAITSVVGAKPIINTGVKRTECDLLQDSKIARRRVFALTYWTPTTHQWCSHVRQEWVTTIMLIATRLGTCKVLVLPTELWWIILGFIPCSHLGNE